VRRSVGLETRNIYKIYEIEGIKDLSNKKCALFVHSDEAENFQNEDHFRQQYKTLEDYR
jgi:hypothetical protein